MARVKLRLTGCDRYNFKGELYVKGKVYNVGDTKATIMQRKEEANTAGPPSLEQTIEVLQADLKAIFSVNQKPKFDVKIISKEQLPDFLGKGYELVHQINEDEFIIRQETSLVRK